MGSPLFESNPVLFELVSSSLDGVTRVGIRMWGYFGKRRASTPEVLQIALGYRPKELTKVRDTRVDAMSDANVSEADVVAGSGLKSLSAPPPDGVRGRPARAHVRGLWQRQKIFGPVVE